MHRTRKEASKKLPIPRKGTKYIARASSNLDNSVSVVMAVRDMLNLAQTAKEVRKMIHQKLLKVNGRVVKEYNQSIQLFNILEADKSYELSLLPTKKFTLVQTKAKDQRLCKVVNRRLVKGNAIQLNLHDGTNLISKEKIGVGDSVYLDFNNKVKKVVSVEKGKEVLIISGKYAGMNGKVESVNEGKASVKLEDKSVLLDSMAMVAL